MDFEWVTSYSKALRTRVNAAAGSNESPGRAGELPVVEAPDRLREISLVGRGGVVSAVGSLSHGPRRKMSRNAPVPGWRSPEGGWCPRDAEHAWVLRGHDMARLRQADSPRAGGDGRVR